MIDEYDDDWDDEENDEWDDDQWYSDDWNVWDGVIYPEKSITRKERLHCWLDDLLYPLRHPVSYLRWRLFLLKKHDDLPF